MNTAEQSAVYAQRIMEQDRELAALREEVARLEGLILDSEIDFQAGLRAEARRIREREGRNG